MFASGARTLVTMLLVLGVPAGLGALRAVLSGGLSILPVPQLWRKARCDSLAGRHCSRSRYSQAHLRLLTQWEVLARRLCA